MTTPNAYEEKQERKRERLLARADKADAEAQSRFKTAQSMASVIPFGQPILVGHHSEKRDRNYRARIDGNYRKSFEANNNAKELRSRAASVGKGGVSSDDPEAVKKLKMKLEKAEKWQAFMKSFNAGIRRRKKDGGAKLRAVCEEHDISSETCAKMLKPDCFGGIGFASYQLSNNNANIRRMKRRIKTLEAQAGDETTEEQIGGRSDRGERRREPLAVVLPRQALRSVPPPAQARRFQVGPVAGLHGSATAPTPRPTTGPASSPSSSTPRRKAANGDA